MVYIFTTQLFPIFNFIYGVYKAMKQVYKKGVHENLLRMCAGPDIASKRKATIDMRAIESGVMNREAVFQGKTSKNIFGKDGRDAK